jgi:hypothetical protein
MDKQTAAVASLLASLANVAIAFNLADPTIAAGVQSAVYGIVALILTILHQKDQTSA